MEKGERDKLDKKVVRNIYDVRHRHSLQWIAPEEFLAEEGKGKKGPGTAGQTD